MLPALLVLLAAYADSRGSHRIAFDLLLVAVPAASVATLGAFGSFLERREEPAAAFHALGWGLVVVLLTLSCAVRSAALHALPPLAFSTVVLCLGIFALQAGVAVAPFARRLVELRPAKP
jgi:hypothetical protein